MAKLKELCSLIRSKNAGPFVLTLDLMFRNREGYERAKRAQPITTDLLAALYRQAKGDIVLVYHDAALAIKASMPRPVFQGELGDSDCYGGQQYVPLLDIEVA
jgi:ribosomal protein L21E